MRDIERFKVKDKEVTLHISEMEGAPLIVWNDFDGDGTEVVREAEKLGAPSFSLLSIGNIDWNHDMAPWECDPLFRGDSPYTGGADDHLSLILDEILPEAESLLQNGPEFIGMAGYSLAGLFALYSMYRTDVFSRVASMSGSLWYPGFTEYIRGNDMKRTPDRIYLSLGDKEARTRQPLMKTVQENTEKIASYYESLGYDVTWELNPGNHFREPMLRSAKGIIAILSFLK